MNNIFAVEDRSRGLGLKGVKETEKNLLEVKMEIKAVERNLRQVLTSEDSFVQEVCEHLLKAEGKRLRPTLAFLAGQFGEYNPQKLLPLATAVEILHMATLIHDDIIDRSPLRRGLPTINSRWDGDIGILMGDYLYGKTLVLLGSLGEKVILSFSSIVTKLIEGEMDQKANLFNPEVTLEDYYKRIHNKTSYFISQCCYLGALVCNGVAGDLKLLENYGDCLGMAFQIQDDLLDFTEDSQTIGKPSLEDLKRGILTLPIIYTIKNSDKAEELKKVIKKGNFTESEWDFIIEETKKTAAIDYSKKLARYYSLRAREWIKTLPEGSGKNSLEFLTYFVTERKK